MKREAMESQTNKAIQFRQLHRGPGALILPNAWDVASARIFEEAGFPAIATTSAGIAFSLGYPDGQRIPHLPHALQAEESVAHNPPAAFPAEFPSQHVDDRIHVRRDIQSPPPQVVSGIDDNRQFFLRNDLAKAIHELGAAG